MRKSKQKDFKVEYRIISVYHVPYVSDKQNAKQDAVKIMNDSKQLDAIKKDPNCQRANQRLMHVYRTEAYQ